MNNQKIHLIKSFPHLVLFIIAVLGIMGCNNKQKSLRCDFFQNRNDFIKPIFINLDSVGKNNGRLGYYAHFAAPLKKGKLYWMKGFVYEDNNAIYCQFEYPDFYPFKLFDFNLQTDSSEIIHWKCNLIDKRSDSIFIALHKDYQLRLDSKFYDRKIGDTIYKFTFVKFGVIPEGDLVFFVGKKSGVVGCYLSVINKDIFGKSYPKIFAITGNIYKDRFDYSEYREGRIE
jgi:hypothetical protein